MLYIVLASTSHTTAPIMSLLQACILGATACTFDSAPLPPARQCFHVPLVRHVFWWLGVRPVTKASIHALLKQGRSVVIIPGGVQEILLMQHDREVAYLR